MGTAVGGVREWEAVTFSLILEFRVCTRSFPREDTSLYRVNGVISINSSSYFN